MRYCVFVFTENFSSHSLVKIYSTLSSAKNFILKHKDDYPCLSIYCYHSDGLFCHSYSFSKSDNSFKKYC